MKTEDQGLTIEDLEAAVSNLDEIEVLPCRIYYDGKVYRWNQEAQKWLLDEEEFIPSRPHIPLEPLYQSDNLESEND